MVSQAQKEKFETNKKTIKEAYDLYIDSSNSLPKVVDLLKLSPLGFDRKILANAFDYFGLPKKTKEQISRSKGIQPIIIKSSNEKLEKLDEYKNINDGLSLIEMYNKGESLSSVASRANVSSYELDRYFKSRNVKIRSQKTFRDLMQAVENSNDISIDVIRQWYVEDNLKFSEVLEKINTALNIDYVIGNKILYTFLQAHSIKKTSEGVKSLQGEKSRSEKDQNMVYLSLVGFPTIEALANFYEENTDFTPNRLVRELNNKLKEVIPEVEFEFTERWLGRHMTPLVSKVRLGSVSRAELDFRNFVISVYDGVVESSYRKLIAPKEVDVFLPELKLAFEFNGAYWHSDKFMLENHGMSAVKYHALKESECASVGVELHFVDELEWYDSREVVESHVQELISSKSP